MPDWLYGVLLLGFIGVLGIAPRHRLIRGGPLLRLPIPDLLRGQGERIAIGVGVALLLYCAIAG